MKKLLSLCSLLALPLWAQAPAESEDVMLQAFYWDSQKETGWIELEALAPEIAPFFSVVWLPPSASAEGGGAVGGNNVGYHPRQWNNQTSCWGTAENLKKLIATLHEKGVKVLADIVINHRAGNTDWGNFTADDFGTYGSYQLTAEHICRNDEMNTDPGAGSWNGKPRVPTTRVKTGAAHATLTTLPPTSRTTAKPISPGSRETMATTAGATTSSRASAAPMSDSTTRLPNPTSPSESIGTVPTTTWQHGLRKRNVKAWRLTSR